MAQEHFKQFQALPPAKKEIFTDPALVRQQKKLYNTFELNQHQQQSVSVLLLQVLAGQIALESLPYYFQKNIGLEPDDAKIAAQPLIKFLSQKLSKKSPSSFPGPTPPSNLPQAKKQDILKNPKPQIADPKSQTNLNDRTSDAKILN